MRGTRVTALGAALLALACEKPKPNVTINAGDPGVAQVYIVLRNEPDTATRGWPGRELHVALPLTATEADERVTLQHVIDSLSSRDTSALWLRVTAFVPDKPTPGRLDVLLHPAMQAIWAPPDTSDPASRSHKAMHRIFYTVIAPPADSSKR